MPRVPSAPINSFSVSKPAEDLRDRRRVLITSPEGTTMVYFVIYSQAEVRVVVVEHFVTDGESYGMVRYVESP